MTSELLTAEQSPQGRERFVVNDFVDPDVLPRIKTITAHQDPTAVLALVGIGPHRVGLRKSKHISEVSPGPVTTWEDLGLDIAGMNESVRSNPEHAPKFQKVLRMGGAFNQYKAELGIEDAEAFAVGTMGVHASLRTHGTAQAIEAFNLMTMQQRVHRLVWRGILQRFGTTNTAIAAYKRVSNQFPNFRFSDVRNVTSTGHIHDYGEAEMGVDIPLEHKLDPNYSTIEASAAVKLATQLHWPDDPRLRRLLEQRAQLAKTADPLYYRELGEDVGQYLHPNEISRAIFGTERQSHGQLLRGDVFGPTIERKEYVLSGLHAFQAIEHDFNGVRDDFRLASALGRLGVSTLFNSLPTLASRAEVYIGAYDFLRRHEDEIDRYMDEVLKVIQDGVGQLKMNDSTIFTVDPFNNYRVDERRPGMIDRETARQKFLETVSFWREWKRREHLTKALWEAYVGTEGVPEHSLDTPFIEHTASAVPQRNRKSGRGVRVIKPITVFGFNPTTA